MKSWGSLIMIISFVVQWQVTEPLNNKVSDRKDFARNYILVRLAAQNYLVMFEQSHDVKHLSSALHEHSGAVLMALLYAGFSQNDLDRNLKRLNELSQPIVKDEQDFVSRTKLITVLDSTARGQFGQSITSLDRDKSISQYAVFAISLIGLLLVWRGENHETNGNSPKTKKKVSQQ